MKGHVFGIYRWFLLSKEQLNSALEVGQRHILLDEWCDAEELVVHYSLRPIQNRFPLWKELEQV